MNWYKHHLGDYDSHTAHLSWDEDLAYTRLLRAYYRLELPVPEADPYRLVRAVTNDQRAAVDAVLKEFFILAGAEWHNKRADQEIAAYRAQVTINRQIATNRQRTVHDSSTNRSTNRAENRTNRTPNQIPDTKKELRASTSEKGNGQSQSFQRTDAARSAIKQALDLSKGREAEPLPPPPSKFDD